MLAEELTPNAKATEWTLRLRQGITFHNGKPLTAEDVIYAFLDHVGLGAAYQARTGSGIYTAESHLCFVSGVTEGAVLRYRTQLLGHDEKRMHVFHQMTSADQLAAT